MKVLDASIILLAVINLNVQRSLAVLGRGIGRIARNKEMGDKDDHVRFRMMVKEDEHPRDRIIVAKHDDSISGISNAANKRQSSKPREEFSQSTSNMAAIRHLYIDVASKSIFATNSGSRTLQQDACDSDLSTMSTCVNSNDGCDTDCITQALEEIFYSQSGDMQCSYFSSEFCPRVSTCGCETCKDEITGYLSCIASCTIQCSSEYTPYPDTDKSASSTTEDDYCPDEYEAARDCTASMDACAACMDYAYNSMFGPDNTTSCSSFVNGICPAITTNCDCGDCRQAIQDYYSCIGVVQGCPALDCHLDDGSGVSIGVILGVLGGTVVLIGFVVGTTVCCCHRRHHLGTPVSKPIHSDNLSIPGSHNHGAMYNPALSPGSPISSIPPAGYCLPSQRYNPGPSSYEKVCANHNTDGFPPNKPCGAPDVGYSPHHQEYSIPSSSPLPTNKDQCRTVVLRNPNDRVETVLVEDTPETTMTMMPDPVCHT